MGDHTDDFVGYEDAETAVVGGGGRREEVGARR